MFAAFEEHSGDPAIRGFLHLPGESNGDAIALTHGAGGNCQSRLLLEMANALAAAGFTVLRFDLPFRTARSYGPPGRGCAERDRAGLRRVAVILKGGGTINRTRGDSVGRVFLGGHSYGGRQTTLLLAEDPSVADGLLLLSYPLHPPKKPAELRVKHFPFLTRPAFFVHGTRDPFGSIEEVQSALELIPGPHALLDVEGAGHELLPKKSASDLPSRIAREFELFLAACPARKTL